MKITIQIDGVELPDASLRSVSDLIQQLRKLTRQSRSMPTGNAVGKPAQELGTISYNVAQSPAHITLRFLRLIRDEPDGVPANAIMEVLDAKTLKAIGGRSVKVNRTLEAIGLKPSRVYRNEDTPQGRIWKAAELLPQALGELQKLVTGEAPSSG